MDLFREMGLPLNQLHLQRQRRGSLGLMRSQSAFPVVAQHVLAGAVEQCYGEIGWCPLDMIELRPFKGLGLKFQITVLLKIELFS